RPHLDAAETGDWDVRGNAQRLIHILGVEQDEAAEMLFRLDEGPVGCRRVTAARPYAHCRRGIGERPRRDLMAASLELLVMFQGVAVEDLLLFIREGVNLLPVEIDQAKVFHRSSPPKWWVRP